MAAAAERTILVWERHAAVTTGGKAHFFVAHVDYPASGRMARIVWDRSVRAYRATVDGRTNTPAALLGFFTSYRRAMKVCQDWVNK